VGILGEFLRSVLWHDGHVTRSSATKVKIGAALGQVVIVVARYQTCF
jgi:hypothetical protein